ncbi:MAG: threonine/serine exporter family protein [Muribaculaceae bacterium]|nr:threonine/serine exporter family protein [Muribaculaceae bacterium]MDE6330925.1 threonine/serine exporter family protein [Muribaculaceae bacterium]
MLTLILQDAFFSAVAAVGFSAISRPPKVAFLCSAVTAAVGHSVRFWLMNPDFGPGLHIILATLIGSFVVGLLAVFLSPIAGIPAETTLFPSLLPMIPGIYAYKAFGGLAMCVLSKTQDIYNFYFYQFSFNGFMTLALLLCMAVGSTLPIFFFEKIAYQATRHRKAL